MAKVLYWHLTPQEVSETPYPTEKLIHWEVRCGFSEESYISIYWFKVGIPYDKEPINGVAMYTVECSKEVSAALEEYLSKTIGGNMVKRGHRAFFAGANVARDNKSLSDFAKKLVAKFNAGGEIWLEFDGLTDQEAQTLFPEKAVPIAN
ncbi:MAG: hypothetical protein QXU32_03640 [Nitrososphaerales archaeon]